MAIINCPACKKRMSSLHTECPNCGYVMSGDDSGEKLERMQRRLRRQRLNTIRFQVYAAMLVTLGGGGYYWFQTVNGGDGVPGLVAGALGAIWYIGARGWLVWAQRRE